MSVSDSHARIKARVWKEIAQAELDLTALPKPVLEELVEIVTDAALVEIDSYLAQSLQEGGRQPAKTSGTEAAPFDPDNLEENVLWEGRPFLSITTKYVITNERVRIVEGLLGKSREDVELVRVQDIDHSQTFRERVLKLGDITIRSHDRSHPIIVLNNVQDPEAVHELLRRAVLTARKKHGLTYREEM